MRRGKRKHRRQNWLVSVIVLVVLILAGMGAFGGEDSKDAPKTETVDVLEEADSSSKAAEEALDAEAENEDSNIPASKEDKTDSEVVVDGKMAVHFLDVGQGLAIFAQCDGMNLIYDGGDKSTSSEVVAYLKNMGVETIDYLISSHYDSDHVSGLIGCLNAFDVANVICADYVHESKTYESFISTVEEKGLAMQHPAVGTEFAFGSGKFVILAPEEFDDDESNANSVVIRLIHGENSFLITGDAEYSSEEAMCNSGLDIESNVLVPGHHGSATATSWDFLMQVVPEYAVISCGEGNSYGHPHEETMEKLESMEVQVYRTDKQGYISVVSDGKTLDWSQEPCNDYSSGD